MPLLLLPLALLLLLVLTVVSAPFSVVRRYRMGTARQRARGWLAACNVFGLAVSAAIFLVVAALSAAWVPRAFAFSALGLAGGCALGVLGLVLTRWEPGPQGLHFTPNPWLVLAITAVVAARLAFGFWRAWQSWHAAAGATSWLAAAGLASSLAAGGVVLGYYLTFWTGVWQRTRTHRRGAATLREG